MKVTQIALMLGLVAILFYSFAQAENTIDDTAINAKPIETFNPPTRIKTKTPKFPVMRQKQGKEGWAEVNFMVDTAGKPYDITVVGGTGDNLFEKATIRAVKQFLYEPAVFQGQPIDAGVNHRITYELMGPAGASGSFIGKFRRFQKFVNENNQNSANKKIDELYKSKKSLYEEAFFYLAKFLYAAKWQDKLAQLEHLKQATYVDNLRGFLPDDLLVQLMQTKIQMQLEMNRLRDAKKDLKSLSERELEPDLAARVASMSEKLDKLIATKPSVSTQYRLTDSYRGFHRLINNQFSLSDINGDVAELRLHCDKGRVGFIHSEGTQYTVDPSWKNCGLIMIGDPGTTLTVHDGV